jgi:phage terminase large subunit
LPQTIQIPNNGWRPRWYQQPAWDSWERGCRRQLLFWHRRAGKDEINLNMHAVSACERPGTYWHMLPEAAQARKAIWNAVNPHSGKRRLFEAFPDALIANMNDNEMFLRFKTGATFQVVGSDNYNSLVGSPPIGITFSEWALANPSAWAYLSPILAENGGWASFITTPRGNNHAKGMLDAVKGNAFDPMSNPNGWFTEVLPVSATHALSEETIEEQRAVYVGIFGKEIADLLIDQEFYCSFAGAMLGSFWGAEMARAESSGRMRVVAIDPAYPVHTAWDLGKAVNNPIWCFQVIPVFVPNLMGGRIFSHNEIRIVDFYRPDTDDLEQWCIWLDEHGYKGNDYVPHDVMTEEWGTNRNRFETLKSLKRNPKRVAKVSVADGINAGRQTIKLASFHTADDERGERMELGVDGLKNYRREWDDELKTFREHPVKDWAEHIGSSFRYLSLAWKDAAAIDPKPPKPKSLEYVAAPSGVIQGNMSVKDAVAAMVKRRQEGR